MITAAANDAFWADTAARICLPEAEPQPPEGLAAFVESQAETRPLIYFRTSGSEGLPKWVGLSREAMLHSAKAVNDHLEATSRDRWLIALPLHHVGGFSILARCFERRSSRSAYPGKWDPVQFAIQCRNEGITLISLVPTQIYDLIQARLPAPDSVRAIVVGGGALNRDVALRALELGWPVLQSFGMTETASQIATEPLEHLRSGFDPDSLEVLPCWDLSVSAQGVLTVKGTALAAGYVLGDGHGGWAWQAISREQGLVTRDLVQTWDHGRRKFLRFVGREASFVKVLGELVSVPEVQAILERYLMQAQLPATHGIIWPVPDARQGTRLVLVAAVPDPALKPAWDEVLRKYNEGVPGYQRLGECLAVPAIPRTALGKVDKVAMEESVRGQMVQR